MDINRFRNAEIRISDSMSDGYSNRLNDDCFYFQISEDQKEAMEQFTEYFKKMIEERYERTVNSIEFIDDGYDDAWEGHIWTVDVEFSKMRTFKLEDKAHIDNEENSPHTVKECLEYILNNYDGDLAGIERYYNELLKDGGGTTNWDEGISLSWKDCVWNENWEDFEMVRNYADIIFD